MTPAPVGAVKNIKTATVEQKIKPQLIYGKIQENIIEVKRRVSYGGTALWNRLEEVDPLCY